MSDIRCVHNNIFHEYILTHSITIDNDFDYLNLLSFDISIIHRKEIQVNNILLIRLHNLHNTFQVHPH